MLDERRYLGAHRDLAYDLFQEIESLPLVCPHGHVDPTLLSDPEARFPNPVELFLKPDHYLLRMFHSQGCDLGFLLGEDSPPREVWRLFCENYHLFWGTPSAHWLDYQFTFTLGLTEPIRGESADASYDFLCERLEQPEFRPRALYERFQIEVLCTTDAATDSLEPHRTVAESEWSGKLLPTFRPDKLFAFQSATWSDELHTLQSQVKSEVTRWSGFLEGLRERREFFKSRGAVATDHGCVRPHTTRLSSTVAAVLFEKALAQTISAEEAELLQAHLLTEMAEMSCDDGLVMQLHPGSFRNHDPWLFSTFGADKGADIPLRVDFTEALRSLLGDFGNHPNFRLLVFTLDESTYSRELAPLAGYYPCLRLGPPWWFHDSLNGMLRYFDQVMETAGLFNTAGFNDDTRAFCSIPARHDLWRRVSCRWVAGLIADGRVTTEQGRRMVWELAVGRAREAYKL